MYRLRRKIILNTMEKTYDKIVVVDRMPLDGKLKDIVKLVRREKLSPFKEMPRCIFGILHPSERRLLSYEELPILLTYLMENGYTIDTKLGKNFNDRDLICYVCQN